MKKLDRFAIYVIACFLALNNAYQMIGTDYDFAYATWIVIAGICLGAGFCTLIFKD